MSIIIGGEQMSQFYYREDELQKLNKRYTGGKGYIIGSCKYRNEKIGVDELELIRDYAFDWKYK